MPGMGRYFAGFFPRRGERGLLLSRFDELLLGCLDDEWATPSSVYVRALRQNSPLVRWIERSGDALVSERLRQWSLHPSGCLERRLEDQQRGPMRAASYRLLTPREARITAIADAPMMQIGGATAYNPEAWVCVQRGGRLALAREQ